MSECRCETLDANEGGGADPRSCPEHAYEAGRRHERNVYLEERAELQAKLQRQLEKSAVDRDSGIVVNFCPWCGMRIRFDD